MAVPSSQHDSRNHYDVLSVVRDAPPEIIRAAWLAVCRAHHPDRNPGDAAAAERISAANAAYETLSNPAARAEYDRSLREPRWTAAAPADASAATGGMTARIRRTWLVAGTGILAAVVAAIGFGLAARKASLAESAWMRPTAVPASPAQAAPAATADGATLRLSTTLDSMPPEQRDPIAAK